MTEGGPGGPRIAAPHPRVDEEARRDRKPSREQVVSEIVGRLDATLAAPALVLGSFPPGGRDLELLVRPPELRAAAAHLTAEGLCRRGLEWARFFDCSAYAVELVPAERLCLPESELSLLFDEARPIDGPLSAPHLLRPDPHHVLLLQARRLVRDGVLAPKRRPRIARALEEDPEAWSHAAERAPHWGLRHALDLLRRVYEEEISVTPWRRARPFAELLMSAGSVQAAADLSFRSLSAKVIRPNRIVAISGLDGAGKSFQARALMETLEGLVVPSVVEWTPFGFNRVLDALRAPRKLVSRPPASVDGTNDGAVPATSVPDSRARRLRERSAVLTHVWATIVVLVNVVSHRRSTFRYPWRGRVVVHDRYTCDSAVQLHFWYGESRPFRFEKWLLRTLSPRPLRSFFLDLPPEVALLRKGEYTIDELRRHARLYRAEYPRTGAERLDAERLPEELCAEIAATVWTATFRPR